MRHKAFDFVRELHLRWIFYKGMDKAFVLLLTDVRGKGIGGGNTKRHSCQKLFFSKKKVWFLFKILR